MKTREKPEQEEELIETKETDSKKIISIKDKFRFALLFFLLLEGTSLFLTPFDNEKFKADQNLEQQPILRNFVKDTVIKKIPENCLMGKEISIVGMSQEKLDPIAIISLPSGETKKIQLASTSQNKRFIEKKEVFIFKYIPLDNGIHTIGIMNSDQKLIMNFVVKVI